MAVSLLRPELAQGAAMPVCAQVGGPREIRAAANVRPRWPGSRVAASRLRQPIPCAVFNARYPLQRNSMPMHIRMKADRRTSTSIPEAPRKRARLPAKR